MTHCGAGAAPAALLALAFVNPALLGGLGLAALPVLVHLLSRRQFRRIAWGATRFLLEAERQNRRRVRFEQWLLVALRCLAMLLLTLLVARPFVQPGLVAALLGGPGPVQRIIILDDSASVGFRSGTTTDISTLRQAARRLLAWLHTAAASDPVTVRLTSQPDEPLIAAQRLTDTALEDLAARLDTLDASNLPARPQPLIDTVVGELAAAGRGVRADVYVLSDFQRSEWLPSDAQGASVFAPLARLAPDAVRVVLIATGTAERENIALLDVQPERPQVVAGVPAVLAATIANYTRHELAELFLQVEAAGMPLPPVPVGAIAPGATHTVPLEVTFPDVGYQELIVSLQAADGLPADDVRRLTAPVKPALAVLLVNGAPATDALRDEVYFLRSALAPAGPFASGIRVQGADPEQLEALALDRFDCLALCNVPPPRPGAVAALQRFVQAGGGLLIFLGDRVGEPDGYNRVLYRQAEGLLPLPLVELYRSPAGEPGVGLVRTGEHPVTAMLPAGDAALPEYVRFRTFYRCAEEPSRPGGAPASGSAPSAPRQTSGAPDTAADGPDHADADSSGAGGPSQPRPPPVVLGRFTDTARTPALVERPFGRGRVLLFTSSVDLDWNDWPRAPDGSYVVTLLELVQYAARRSDDRPAFLAGQMLSCSLPPESYEPRAVFRWPAPTEQPPVEARLKAAAIGVGEPIVLLGPVATRLGSYTVELTRRDGSVETRPLSVNLDPRESDLAVARPAELEAALGPVPHEYLLASAAFLEGQGEARRELWPALLLALAVLLMVEQTLAWWFGLPRGYQRPREARRHPGGAVPGAAAKLAALRKVRR